MALMFTFNEQTEQYGVALTKETEVKSAQAGIASENAVAVKHGHGFVEVVAIVAFDETNATHRALEAVITLAKAGEQDWGEDFFLEVFMAARKV